MPATPAKTTPATVNRILIVDDNDEIREAFAELVRMIGHEAVLAADGAEALSRLRNGLTPCLILLDYHMPVMDGLTFRQEQMADPAIAAIPIVLYSGAYDIRHYAEQLQVPHVFQKPLDITKVLQLAERYC